MNTIHYTVVILKQGTPAWCEWRHNGKMRDELLNGEMFDTILEARVVTEQWRREYNQRRPHSALGYRPPAPETILPVQVNQLDLNKELTIIPVGT